MNLDDFMNITRLIGAFEAKGSLRKPNAVLVSRKIYTTLSNEMQSIVNDGLKERISGLALYVDDDLPDDFYCVGQAKVFIDYIISKSTIKKLNKAP